MCDPVSATVGVLVGAGNMVAQGQAASSAARAQNRYRGEMGKAQDEAYWKTVEGVRKDVGLQTDALFAQRNQQIDAVKQELQNITRDSRQASSSYAAVTAETGIEGRTVDLVHQQFERDVLEFESAAIRNISNMTAQTNREAQAIYSRGQSIINSGYPSPLPPPASVSMGPILMNGIASGLQVGMMMNSAFGSPNPGSLGRGSVSSSVGGIQGGTVQGGSWIRGMPRF